MSSMPDLFHVSQEPFDQPDRDAGVRSLLLNGELEGRHPKGALGLWLSPNPKACDGLGSYAAHPEFSRDTIFAAMPLSQLRKLANDVDGLSFVEQVHAMSALGVAMSEDCDVLLIEDATEQVGEVIVLSVDCIESWSWMHFADACTRASAQRTPWDHVLPSIDAHASKSISGWRLTESGEPVRSQQGPRP